MKRTLGGGKKPKVRAPGVLSAAEWARIEKDAQQSEKKPDPAQINFLAPAPETASG